MNANPAVKFVARVGLALTGFFVASTMLFAQDAGTGIIEGRVFKPSTGEYLELVRVTVEGTALEALTDAAGHYLISRVPPGYVRLKAFRTGLEPETQNVTVGAGRVVQQDFSMKPLPGSEVPVQMGTVVVSAPKEMEGAAIAINTQRFAPNQVTVIASDELGPIPLQNVGQVLQTLPDITMTQGGMGEPNTISIAGVPSDYVPVTFNGFNFAGAGASTARTVGVHQVSLNNISRVEVAFTPTPETPGSALAGTVNMVPKHAFERAKPVYTATASLLMRDTDLTLGKSPGGRRGPARKVLPGFDFAAIVPVNQRFGFTLTAATSPMYTPLSLLGAAWRGTSAPTGGAFPDTTPDKPYLTTFLVRDAVRFTRHTAYAGTIDYRLSPHDTVTFTINYALFDWKSNDRQMNFTINRVLAGDFGPTFTHGAAGGGALQQFDAAQDVYDTLYMPTITFRHRGPVWIGEIGAALSHARRFRRDLSHGIFASAVANRPNVTIWFDDVRHDGPGSITIRDGTTGALLDPLKASTYSLLQATGNEVNAFDVQRSAFANGSRVLALPIPITVKAGLDVRQQMRDLRSDVPVFPYVGANRDASQVLDQSFSQRNAPFWYDRIEWISALQLWDLRAANPQAFGPVNEAARHNTLTAQSKFAQETISSGYVRGDASLMGGRLRLVGGLRAEQTNVEGQGDRIDVSRNFERDASGKVILGANGQPLPVTSDPTQIAKLTHIDRGLIAKKEYFRWFPSLNATYGLRENVLARAGYYRSIGRPDFNQYGGSLTLPNTQNPPAANNVITVNNAAIKPWRADTVRLGLEYYFDRVGLISVSGFRRDFRNFFGPAISQPTPDFLAHYSLDPTIYGPYNVATQQNVAGTVRMTGFNVNYKQALTFLPNWARGVQLVASYSQQRATGTGTENFAGFIPQFGNWGVTLSRPKYTLRAQWVYRARARQARVAPGGSVEPGTYFWGERRLQANLTAEYLLTSHFTAFANLTNLSDAPIDTKVYGPSTPRNAEFNGRLQYGAQWLMGVRAKF